MDDQWLIIHGPDGSHVWALGDPDEAELVDLVDAGRALVGFPAHDRWPGDGQGWMLFVSRGEPHHTLMTRARVGTADDLATVDRRLVAAHRDARQEASRAAHLERARAVVAGLDDEALRALLADPAVAARLSRPNKGA